MRSSRSSAMESKYAVKLSITDLFKFNRKCRKRYNGRLWKMQIWSDFIMPQLIVFVVVQFLDSFI